MAYADDNRYKICRNKTQTEIAGGRRVNDRGETSEGADMIHTAHRLARVANSGFRLHTNK